MRRTVAVLYSVLYASCALPAAAAAQPRAMTPADLFRVEQVGAAAWSPTGRSAVVEVRRPGRWLDLTLPTNALRVLDVRTGTLRTLAAPGGAYVGFTGATWSPGGRRLLFLSVDTGAVVRPWLWDGTAARPRLLRGLAVRTGIADRRAVTWADDDHVLILAFDSAAANSGSLYFRLTRGRNAADAWRRARTGEAPTATVVESGGAGMAEPSSRLVSVDLRSGAQRTFLRGALHVHSLSPDRRALALFQTEAGAPGVRTAPFLDATSEDAAYDLVNWGRVLHVLDPATGRPLAPPADLVNPEHESLVWRPGGGLAIRASAPPGVPVPRWMGLRDGRIQPVDLLPSDTARPRAPAPALPFAAPRVGARVAGVSPQRDAALYVTDDSADGTRLWLARTGAPPVAVWRGNGWVRGVRTGRAVSIAYTGTDGTALTGWLLLPPGHVAGTRVPIVTIVYPGQTLGARPPSAFSLLNENFEHPQLFAALGYGVLLPTMPESKTPLQSDAIAALTVGVLPLLDTVVARGIADPARVALLGQSAGGYATLGLVTATDRFRTAIASAGYSDLLSLYGTFSGQYRYGDAGPAQTGQLLRMLQFERGYYGAGAPPWEARDQYLDNSPLLRAARVRTPVMLVHGDLDFVPVQQAEEFFTALQRQDKRARLVRYHGEWHTISARANVLDLWARMADWLRETMPAGDGGA